MSRTYMTRRTGLLACFALALAAQELPARAQNYPTRAIKIIVPFTAGGTSDLLTREIGKGISDDWGQPVVYEYRPGAGGTIAAAQAARSPTDGYTLWMSSSGAMTTNPYITNEKNYDPAKDFAPISMVAEIQNILVVNPAVPVNSVAELIAYAKSHRLIYASYGIGTSPHMCAEMFEKMSGVRMTHVPTKGSNEGLTEVLSGRVNLIFDNIPTAVPLVKAGKLRPLAVTSTHRSALAPEVPTMAEAGMPGYDVTAWYGLVAPRGVPADIVAKLSKEVATILARPEVRERLIKIGTEPRSMSPEEFTKFLAAEQAKWKAFIIEAKLNTN